MCAEGVGMNWGVGGGGAAISERLARKEFLRRQHLSQDRKEVRE